jgi:hypothetical protein
MFSALVCTNGDWCVPAQVTLVGDHLAIESAISNLVISALNQHPPSIPSSSSAEINVQLFPENGTPASA